MSDPIRPEIAAVIKRIDDLRPQLVNAGREGDQLRRIQPAAFDALAATGAFGISAPKRFGGLAANTGEAHAVARAIGLGDGSASWVHCILDFGAWVVSLMDDRAQDDVWGGDKILRSFISIVLAATSDAKPVKGGYRVTGRWTYGTGSLHADWSLLGIPLKDAKGAVVDAGLALIPTSELGVDDNWYVAGMKGTGSVTQVADDVFVPEHRVFPLTAAVEGKYLGSNPEQSYKTIFVPSLFMKLIGPHLGMGRAALDYVIAKAELEGRRLYRVREAGRCDRLSARRRQGIRPAQRCRARCRRHRRRDL